MEVGLGMDLMTIVLVLAAIALLMFIVGRR